MENNRPKGFKNPHDTEYQPGVNSAVDVAEGIAFEAGADAMLEGLKKDCEISLNKAMELWDGDMNGTLVFIPD